MPQILSSPGWSAFWLAKRCYWDPVPPAAAVCSDRTVGATLLGLMAAEYLIDRQILAPLVAKQGGSPVPVLLGR